MIPQAWHRAVFVSITLICAVYLGYRVDRAGGFHAFMKGTDVNRTQPDFSRLIASPVPDALPASSPLARESFLALSESPFERAILDALNAQRQTSSAPPLVENRTLAVEARQHAALLAEWGYLDHTSPEGVTFEGRMRLSGYTYSLVGENLGLTTDADAVTIVAQWMQSPTHRANILNDGYRAVGIGVVGGTYQSISAHYIVAIFGDRR